MKKKKTLESPRAAAAGHKVLRALLKNDGRSYEEIGKDAGISKQRVGQIAKRHGITRAPARGVMQVACVHCGRQTPAVPTIR